MNGAVHAGGVAQAHSPIEKKLAGILEQRMKGIGGIATVFPHINAAMGNRADRVFGTRNHVHGIGVMRHPKPGQTV